MAKSASKKKPAPAVKRAKEKAQSRTVTPLKGGKSDKNGSPRKSVVVSAKTKRTVAPKSTTKAAAKAKPADRGKRAVTKPVAPKVAEVKLSSRSSSKNRSNHSSRPGISAPAGKSDRLAAKANRSIGKADRSTPAIQIKPEPQPLADSVATNLKPRKNQAGLHAKELEHFRDLLLAKRREIVGDMSSMEREALRSGSASNLSTLPMHMADMGTDNYEQEFTLGLVEKDRNLLREINRALGKIQNGTFGICEGTGKPIAKPRLEAQPWARFGIEYARQMEKGGMGVR